jgi:hypothetical protein
MTRRCSALVDEATSLVAVRCAASPHNMENQPRYLLATQLPLQATTHRREQSNPV